MAEPARSSRRGARTPNAGHRALVDLERRGKLHALVTQNIDGLHQRAGNSPDMVIEVHGTMHEVMCMACGWRGPMQPVLDRVRAGEEDPPCAECGGILKSATISFGQALVPEVIARAMRAAEEPRSAARDRHQPAGVPGGRRRAARQGRRRARRDRQRRADAVRRRSPTPCFGNRLVTSSRKSARPEGDDSRRTRRVVGGGGSPGPARAGAGADSRDQPARRLPVRWRLLRARDQSARRPGWRAGRGAGRQRAPPRRTAGRGVFHAPGSAADRPSHPPEPRRSGGSPSITCSPADCRSSASLAPGRF